MIRAGEHFQLSRSTDISAFRIVPQRFKASDAATPSSFSRRNIPAALQTFKTLPCANCACWPPPPNYPPFASRLETNSRPSSMNVRVNTPSASQTNGAFVSFGATGTRMTSNNRPLSLKPAPTHEPKHSSIFPCTTLQSSPRIPPRRRPQPRFRWSLGHQLLPSGRGHGNFHFAVVRSPRTDGARSPPQTPLFASSGPSQGSTHNLAKPAVNVRLVGSPPSGRQILRAN